MPRQPRPIRSDLGHLLEETERPMALEVWQRVDDGASEHLRPKGG
jgi:citrate synthase